MSRFAAFLLAPLLAACGAESTDVPSDPAARLLEPPPPTAGRQLTMDISIGAGQEAEKCHYVVVEEAFDIARFEHAYSSGSHHLLVYQTGLSPADARTDTFDCAGAPLTELGVTGIAYVGQVPAGEFTYPEDVGLKIAAGSVLLIQTHYLNGTDADLDAQVRVNLWYRSEPAPVEAGTLFFYDWAIVVPAGERASARMRCAVTGDVQLLFAMSHMHRRGIGFEAVLENDGARTTLFETDRWEGVDPVAYEPLQPVAANSVIDFRCDYQGEPGRTIIEGPSAEANEMCMFVAAYYPRIDRATELCQLPGSGPVFDGDRTCLETMACVGQSPDRAVREHCQIATCEASSVAVSDLLQCRSAFCAQACPQNAPTGAACDQCVAERCANAQAACASATCGE